MGILRLLLALSVISWHCGPILGSRLVGGQIAVQAFYIISGFYMSLILNEKYIGKNKSYRLFITNRFFRIYPIYWTVLVLAMLASIGASFVSKSHFYPVFENYALLHANYFSFGYLILTNIFIFCQDIILFLGVDPQNGSLFFTNNYWNSHPPLFYFVFVPQAWTLALELTFYLIAPFILTRGLRLIVILIACSFLLRLYVYNYLGLQNDPWTHRFFPTELKFFLFGYLSYRIYLRIKKIAIPASFNLIVLISVIAFTVLFSYFPTIKLDYVSFSLNQLIYFLCIILAVPLLFNFFKQNKLDAKIGELSYPVYISHLLVAMVLNGQPFSVLKTGWAISLATIIFSYFLNKMIASPIEKFRQSRLDKLPTLI